MVSDIVGYLTVRITPFVNLLKQNNDVSLTRFDSRGRLWPCCPCCTTMPAPIRSWLGIQIAFRHDQVERRCNSLKMLLITLFCLAEKIIVQKSSENLQRRWTLLGNCGSVTETFSGSIITDGRGCTVFTPLIPILRFRDSFSCCPRFFILYWDVCCNTCKAITWGCLTITTKKIATWHYAKPIKQDIKRNTIMR